MTKNTELKIDATGIYYKELNEMIRQEISRGVTDLHLSGVNGQRYIGGGLKKPVSISVEGVPGNDLGNFMDGAVVTILNNAQDAISNTMNAGKIIVHGDAGDVLGYGMRGGKLFVRGNVGYRVGIHMKSFKEQVPTIVVGGKAQDFFGEYMAGGMLVLLDLDRDGQPIAGSYFGTGMHGGVIYVRGELESHQLGKEVAVLPLNERDTAQINELIKEYCQDLSLNFDEVMSEPFSKVIPISHRPYGKMYAY